MTEAALSSPPAKPSAFHELEVLWVRHWTDQLFSFAIVARQIKLYGGAMPNFGIYSGIAFGLPGKAIDH